MSEQPSDKCHHHREAASTYHSLRLQDRLWRKHDGTTFEDCLWVVDWALFTRAANFTQLLTQHYHRYMKSHATGSDVARQRFEPKLVLAQHRSFLATILMVIAHLCLSLVPAHAAQRQMLARRTVIEAIDIGIARWTLPSYADARDQLHEAQQRDGAFSAEANVTVVVPKIGQEDSETPETDTYVVTRSDSDKLIFKDPARRKPVPSMARRDCGG